MLTVCMIIHYQLIDNDNDNDNDSDHDTNKGWNDDNVDSIHDDHQMIVTSDDSTMEC